MSGLSRPRGATSCSRVRVDPEERGEPLHAAVAEDLRQGPREDDAVLERVAHARGRLRPIGEHGEPPVAPAHDVGRVERQEPTQRRDDADARPQKARVTEQQLRRQEPLGEEALGSVEIGEQAVEEPGALRQAGRQRVPGVGPEDHRDGREVPWPRGALAVAVDVVADAVLVKEAPGLVPAPAELLEAERAQLR